MPSVSPRVVLLVVAVLLYLAAGIVALRWIDGNYAALVALGSAAFAGAWIIVPRA